MDESKRTVLQVTGREAVAPAGKARPDLSPGPKAQGGLVLAGPVPMKPRTPGPGGSISRWSAPPLESHAIINLLGGIIN